MQDDSSVPDPAPRRGWPYGLRALVFALVLVPLWTQIALFASMMLFGIVADWLPENFPDGLLNALSMVLTVLSMSAASGWLGARLGRGGLPESAWRRYLPLLVYPLLIWLVWVVEMQVAGGDFTKMGPVLGALLLPFILLLFMTIFSGMNWLVLLTPLWIYAVFVLFFWRASRLQPMRATRFGVGRVMGLTVLGLAAITAWQAAERQRALAPTNGEQLSEEVNLYDYRPFIQGNRLKPVQPSPALRLDLPDAPRLDGAIAAYPLYAAAAQALYSEKAADQRVDMTNTPRAYQRLIDGQTDLIFVAQPSPAQRQRAAERGVELSLTPVAKEAFVFIVHPDNPVQGLTLEQIRAVYSGRIADWRELGGAPGRIVAYQRTPDSGSQTVMEAKVMQGKPMSTPLAEEVTLDMGGLVRQVAAYRDTAQSIGYTFRYYATQMHGDVPLRLLAIDGVAPTAGNIRAGRYPLTVNVYMVTRQNPPAPVRQLMAWFLSAQGQRLIEDVGYVPLQ